MPKTFEHHRAAAAILFGLALQVAAVGQGGSCPPPPSQTPVQPATLLPTQPPIAAWVDPVGGNDQTGAAGTLSAFKTIAAALAALEPLVAAPGACGTVRLMPGLYGSQLASPQHNGEVWPVLVPPRVSIIGASALSVMLDGSIHQQGVPGFSIPDPVTGATVEAFPVFVFGSQTSGYGYNLVSRVTIVNADVGVLLGGVGEVDPVFGHVLFTNCRVGVQVHSTGGPLSGIHRPRFVWCTFGNNALGLAFTGSPQSASGSWPSRARPALVNCLFKNTRDFEGVACDAVDHCAFAPAAINLSPYLLQPAVAPVPLFDSSQFTHRDLFIGAVTLPSAVNAGQTFFTDWRLTFMTQGSPWGPNPAATGAAETFPLSLGNGTSVGLSFPGLTLGGSSAEGAGTGGPPAGSGLPSGLSIGYDQAGTFVIGGTLPYTDGFGLSAGGIDYTTMHLFLRDLQPVYPLLIGVAPSGAPAWTVGSSSPSGVLAQAISYGGFAGSWFLDNITWPLQPVQQTTALLGPGQPGILGGAHWSVPLMTLFPSGRVDFVFQMLYIAPSGTPVFTDAQRMFVMSL